MKTWKTGLTALSILLTSVAPKMAFAGGSDGGGGGAMLCYEKDGKTIKSSEILDLWEAKERPHLWEKPAPYAYKLNIPYSNEPVRAQIKRAMDKLKRLDPYLWKKVQADLEYVMNPQNQEKLPRKQTIELPSDAFNIYSEEGCEVKGMMYFDGETQKLSYKPEAFAKSKSNTARAAAFTHEAIWKTLREMDMNLGDSTPARRINACLYATNDCFGLVDLDKEIHGPGTVYKCTSAQRTFHLIESFRRIVREGESAKVQTRVTLVANDLGGYHFAVPLVDVVDNTVPAFKGATVGVQNVNAISVFYPPIKTAGNEKGIYLEGLRLASPVLRHYLPYMRLEQFDRTPVIIYNSDLSSIVGLWVPARKMLGGEEYLPEENAICERVN
jgi:hypothetical protein